MLTPVILQDESVPSTSKKVVKGRKPIPIKDLRRELEWLEADSGYELSKEYEEIGEISLDWNASCSVAELPDNRSRNRYTDILPCMKHFFFRV